MHGDLAQSPLTWASVEDGWAWVLGALKSVLETGTTLPAWETGDQPGPTPTDGDWHRRQGADANDATFA